MIIRGWFYFGILLFAHMGWAQAPSAISTSSLWGKWIVKDVLCSDCGRRVPAEKGAIIQLTANQIKNPLAEDCTRDPDYGLLSEMSGKQLVAHHGRQWPESVTRALPKHEKVRYGFITCGGINLMQILFLSDKRAFYFFEEGIVFYLQRIDPTLQPAMK